MPVTNDLKRERCIYVALDPSVYFLLCDK